MTYWHLANPLPPRSMISNSSWLILLSLFGVLNVGKVKIFMTYYVPHVSSISLIDHVNCVCHIVYVFNRQIYCVNIVSSRLKHFCHLRIFFLKRSISNREIKMRFLHTNELFWWNQLKFMHCGDIRRVPRVWWLVLGGSTFAGAKSKGHKGGVCRENSLLPASETVKETVPQQQQGLPPTTFSQVRADITHTLFKSFDHTIFVSKENFKFYAWVFCDTIKFDIKSLI